MNKHLLTVRPHLGGAGRGGRHPRSRLGLDLSEPGRPAEMDRAVDRGGDP